MVQTQLQRNVVGIADGDTFTFLSADKKQFRIRIHGIDCPKSGRPFGQVAKHFTSDQIFGKVVSLDSTDTDRYGRMVAIVYYDATKCLNEELLKASLAWHYIRYHKNPAWDILEASARMEKKGLWADPHALPPWEWRRL